MSTIENAINYIQKLMRSIPNIRSAPNAPPDKIALYPFATCYPASGTVAIGEPQGSATARHTLALEIHVARKDMTADISKVVPFMENIITKLRDDVTLGGNVVTISGEVTYQFGPLNWYGQTTIGYQFAITVKLIHS